MHQRCAPRLVVMVKEPRMGRVKTRLARDVGAVTATHVLRANIRGTLLRLARDRRWQTLLAIAPDAARTSMFFPSHLARMGQGAGDIGARMAHVARLAPPGPLIIIGADIPQIAPCDIAQAFAALRACDVVFGPAHDGGYWLVGMTPRLRRRPMFEAVRWSGPHALADTRANLEGCHIAHVDIKDDIDDAASLARAGARAGRVILTPA